MFSVVCLGQTQTKTAPDCLVVLQPLTAAGVSPNWDNRPNAFNQGQPCIYWELSYSAITTTASFSIQMESAGDANGAPGTFSIFGSAGTTVPTGNVANTGYGAFMRIHLTAVTTGTVSAAMVGWRANAVTISSTGGGGPATNVNVTNNPLNTNQAQIGGAAVVADPCQQQARTTAVINTTSSVQLVTGTSAKQTYVCYLQFAISSTADNIALVEGTGSVCGSSTAGMAGGATAATGWNLLANGSVTGGTGASYAYRTATLADNVCFLVSSGAQVSGVIQYVQQ